MAVWRSSGQQTSKDTSETAKRLLSRVGKKEEEKKWYFYIVLNYGLLLFLTSGKGTFHTCNLEAGLFTWGYVTLHDCVSM